MATRNRRIHKFDQSNRLPSIEVYSTSIDDDPVFNYGTGRNARSNGHNWRSSKHSSPVTDFRILSSSLTPHTRYGHARMSNSKSTGNLAGEGGPNEKDGRMDSQPTVQHATSHGRLSARQNSASPSPSPTSHRRGLLANQRRSPHLPRMQSQQNSRYLQSPFASFDDFADRVDDEEEPAATTPQEAVMTFNTEPVTVLGNVIRPGAHETTSRKVEIRYSARHDKYKRPTNPIRTKADGWSTLVYAERNMEWLTEHCHIGDDEEVMTYLSRRPGTSSAYVEWRFDFSEAGLKVKKFMLKFPYETFEDGHVRAYLKTESDEVPVYTSLVSTNIPQVRGWEKFSLVAELSCQRDACAFQHAQLFRQQLKSGFFDKQEEKYQFKVEIELYSMY